MDRTERSLSELEAVRDRFERVYGEFDPIEKTWTHPPSGYREIADVGWFDAPPEDVLCEEVRARPYAETG